MLAVSKSLILYGFQSIFALILHFSDAFCVDNCAISPTIFTLGFPQLKPNFPPMGCGKLCGNCAKPRFSRQIPTRFSKEPVENLVKRFLKTFYFFLVFLHFNQTVGLHIKIVFNIRLFLCHQTVSKPPFARRRREIPKVPGSSCPKARFSSAERSSKHFLQSI